jgi:hypothetical protein
LTIQTHRSTKTPTRARLHALQNNYKLPAGRLLQSFSIGAQAGWFFMIAISKPKEDQKINKVKNIMKKEIFPANPGEKLLNKIFKIR